MPAPPSAATRRAVLAGSLLLLGGAAACDLEPGRRGTAGPTPGPTPGPTEPAADADAGLLERVVAETTAVLALVESVRRRDRPAVQGLVALHRAHLPLLDADVPAAAAAPAAPGRTRLAQVRAREEALQRLLADAAVSVASGPLARLLASMSAGVAQHLAVLPTPPSPTPSPAP